MGSMKKWRQERLIFAYQTGSKLTDTLRFEPRLAGRIVTFFVRRSF